MTRIPGGSTATARKDDRDGADSVRDTQAAGGFKSSRPTNRMRRRALGATWSVPKDRGLEPADRETPAAMTVAGCDNRLSSM